MISRIMEISGALSAWFFRSYSGGGPQVGEVTLLDGVTRPVHIISHMVSHLLYKRDQIKLIKLN